MDSDKMNAMKDEVAAPSEGPGRRRAGKGGFMEAVRGAVAK